MTDTQANSAIALLRDQLTKTILGQPLLVHRIIIALLADGHLLVEGAPGLAKTRAIRSLADHIEADFQRIQFTPDLLPGDITGTDIFRPQTGEFEFQRGPIFHNLVLADEINRAPAKVQAALLEAMAERQVSVGKTTYPLEPLFLVMATQNPIEQEGTYPLPEAQLDRFLLHVVVDYPDQNAERDILQLVRNELINQDHDQPETAIKEITQHDILQARQQVLTLFMSEAVEEYIVQLVIATRDPGRYDARLSQLLEYGASPRATLALDRCARANAWLRGADFVSPDDVQAVAYDVLRHRIILSFEAEANGISADQVISDLISKVPVT
ncbi:MAG: AAA family ATPase [Cellvibrionales bacterium]|jgi:MoxR-like ATPase|nr:AAA family ATPase [Cellvibrionales bacterium]HCH20413.1 AAA family ATPase [Cellvibrionales bacterium]